MVNCWFGAFRLFGFLESPGNERDWDSWVYPDSNPKPPGPKPTINHYLRGGTAPSFFPQHFFCVESLGQARDGWKKKDGRWEVNMIKT